ncbi:sigma-54 interaction domain-containing protein [Engelhardtia mirabilis]|uniref:Transcriptional regulatory protein ZraR n=1 Tax=Engelhardtia mirabilis TaxID=2528011 RepID=A0A518BGL6_9BACT|nr:Transcriptional regulatory protein ZraR [Planctomycetes bacterium Pla133]QDV00431.1 Transcriptional regulatory protein ZraR [Planctomycetes bacterium Pla86]
MRASGPGTSIDALLPGVGDAVGALFGRAVFVVDAQGRVRGWSEEAARRTGLAAADVVGRAIDPLDAGPGRLGASLRERAGTGDRTPFERVWHLGAGAQAGARFVARFAPVTGAAAAPWIGVLTPVPAGEGGEVGIAGDSRALREALRRLRRAAESEVTVLIRGESGTGKELAARALHAWSPRAAGPFVAINCSAIPEALLESELFGHVRGAFTGAERDRAGVFEQAHGGTLFLDEIGELAAELQVRLLRTLQEHEVRPVGSDRSIPVDVRLVSATNRDLARDLESGRLREDFYYRICVFEVVMPPLRERREDVLPIARALVEALARDHARPAPTIGEDAQRALLAHSWPGNVRELRNALEHAFVLCDGDELTPACLPTELRREGRQVAPQIGALGLEAGSDAERDRILRALESHAWNRTATAEALGISRVTLWKKIRNFRLDQGIFRGR